MRHGRRVWAVGSALAISTVTAVECWNSDFTRVYYSDSVEYGAAYGDDVASAFSDAEQSPRKMSQ